MLFNFCCSCHGKVTTRNLGVIKYLFVYVGSSSLHFQATTTGYRAWRCARRSTGTSSPPPGTASSRSGSRSESPREKKSKTVIMIAQRGIWKWFWFCLTIPSKSKWFSAAFWGQLKCNYALYVGRTWYDIELQWVIRLIGMHLYISVRCQHKHFLFPRTRSDCPVGVTVSSWKNVNVKGPFINHIRHSPPRRPTHTIPSA